MITYQMKSKARARKWNKLSHIVRKRRDENGEKKWWAG
jgi:hypothetical protein